jgi:hypothetical protein
MSGRADGAAGSAGRAAGSTTAGSATPRRAHAAAGAGSRAAGASAADRARDAAGSSRSGRVGAAGPADRAAGAANGVAAPAGVAEIAARPRVASAAVPTSTAAAVASVYFVDSVTAATSPSSEGNQQQTDAKRRTSRHLTTSQSCSTEFRQARNEHLQRNVLLGPRTAVTITVSSDFVLQSRLICLSDAAEEFSGPRCNVAMRRQIRLTARDRCPRYV